MAVLKLKPEYLFLGGVLLLFAVGSTFKDKLLNKLASFIPGVENFSPVPYWDVSRYSWGYGTIAPGPPGSGAITREQAFADMVAYLLHDYANLSGRVTRNLTVNQWVALLSFSYNEGIGRAYNLLDNINSGDDSALAAQMRKYIYAGGVVNNDLVERREKEINLWNS
jgi:GH24 family phage-related lysozyme (muramidase)